MAVRLTLLAAPLLGVTLVLLALLPPSSHVASASAAAGGAKVTASTTTAPSTAPRSLPCSKTDGDASRGKRDTKCTMVAAASKRLTSEEAEGTHMSKRAVQPEGLEVLSAEKRAPSSSGFFGMRGKKGADGEGDGEAFKRAPSSSGFFGMRGKKDDLAEGPDSAYYDVEDFDGAADKRAPSSSGFLGMRGKKIPMLGYAPWYRDPKRARLGFFGTRGKKSDDETDYYPEELKRAPAMGFFGSRGKKWDDDGYQYGWGPEDAEGAGPGDKRAAQHMNFFGMRGKRDEGDQTEYDKRAPSSGFFGMRGKKSPGVDGEDWAEDKRAPSSGFFGMRGKKDYGEDGADYEDLYGDQAFKRAPMGFFGMRGKKEYPGYWSEGGDKRAPMGFFGMRGKKDGGELDLAGDELDLLAEEKRAAQHNAFFGMRGKKAEEVSPDGWYQAEAKRGLAGAAVSAWPSSRNPSTFNSLLAYLAGRDAAMAEVSGGSGWRPVRKRFRGNKKAPMGFIGMRGKKADSLSKEVWPPSANTNGENGYQSDSKSQEVADDAAAQNQVEGVNNGSQ
ncbi:tachykinins isoform X2 [Ischnura elegans]|nr:tachykinins isoform X2 [Ischnura elegans]